MPVKLARLPWFRQCRLARRDDFLKTLPAKFQEKSLRLVVIARMVLNSDSIKRG